MWPKNLLVDVFCNLRTYVVDYDLFLLVATIVDHLIYLLILYV